jgi:predicted phosphohydrolase
MGVGGQRHPPAALKNLAPTGIRSPDRPARSESLYRLCYPGPNGQATMINKGNKAYCKKLTKKTKNIHHNRTQAVQNTKQRTNQSTSDVRCITLSSHNRSQVSSKQNKIWYNLYLRVHFALASNISVIYRPFDVQ